MRAVFGLYSKSLGHVLELRPSIHDTFIINKLRNYVSNFWFSFCLFRRKMTKIFSTPWRWQEFSEKWQILQKLAKNMSHLAINQTYSHSKCPFWRIVPKSFWSRISDPPSGYSRFLPVTASIQSSDTWARPRSNLAADWKQKWLSD